MALREIIYLDRERVQSYISQLAGGVAVQEVSSQTDQGKLKGHLRAGLKFVDFQVGAESGATEGLTTTRMPVHAILATLEALLCDAGMMVNGAKCDISPGQIASINGRATFESWGLLAELADSIQGVATLGTKIYATTRGERDVAQMRRAIQELDKLIKQYGRIPKATEAQRELGRHVNGIHTGVDLVDGGYINDAKEVVKLFFQDQNHVRFSVGEKTFVGLLRRDNLVGCTMEELLFTYGTQPKGSFGALFFVAEAGREQKLKLEDLGSRFQSLKEQSASFGLLQNAIREIGSLLLECAEELRRPTGPDAAFIVPLAVYRECSPAREGKLV